MDVITAKDLKYKLGDVVWVARARIEPREITCPHCGGAGRLRVIFHDETTVSIECRNCQSGYDPPTGRVIAYERHPRAVQVTITGFEVGPYKIEYKAHSGASSWYTYKEDDLYATEAEALAVAVKEDAEANAAELRRILEKEKDTRTWAWNASYHRNQLKEAQRNIEYHSKKLAVASLKAKEDRKA